MCLKKFSREVHTPCFKFLSLLVQRFPNKTSEPIRSISAPLSVVSVVRIWGPNRLHSRTIVVPASSPNYDRISVRIGADSEPRSGTNWPRFGSPIRTWSRLRFGFDRAEIRSEFEVRIGAATGPLWYPHRHRITNRRRFRSDSETFQTKVKDRF